jgi:RNA ligase (TIGR02306 family)
MNEILNEVECCEVTDRLELAVVKRVKSLELIPNKDRIELVHLDDCGFTFICEKGHQVGDLVVYVKYDSVLPKIELFDFMADFKYRVKAKSFTEKDDDGVVVKKIYSQGIILPLHLVEMFVVSKCASEGFMDIQETASKFIEGSDLTEALGVTKYIPPVMTGAGSGFGEMRCKGTFPTHILSKTDETTLASKTRALEELRGKAVYITLKIEGSSGTSYVDDATREMIVCSRNNMISETETCKFWIAARKYNLSEILFKEPWLALQWELYGSGIQKNKLKIDGVDLAIFNMINKHNRKRLSYYNMLDLRDMYNLPLVPFIDRIENFDMSFNELQELADVQKYASGEDAEGIVIRPVEPFYSNVLKEDWSVKVINRNYHL